MPNKVTWRGADTVTYNIGNYADKVRLAVRVISAYVSVHMENYAKDNASWTDQTGNARQGLNSWVEEISEDIVRIYLAHGVEYGIYLETKWAGRYAIIWETISAHLQIIYGLLVEMLGAR